VLDKINEAYCDPNGRPYQDIRIRHVVILDDPFEDPEGLLVPDQSPKPSAEQMATVRIPDDVDLNADSGLSPEELEKMLKRREANAQALTLEMVIT